jgi:hypothetical protein
MSKTLSRFATLLFSGAIAVFGVGCSCGDDDGSDRADSSPDIDSAPEDDAGGDPTVLRSGTIAVTEAALTNPGLDTWSGGVVRIGFSDTTTGNSPAPVEGFESNIGGCLIQVWDVGTHTASDPVDEGAVVVTGTENGTFACGFANADLGYVCQSTTPAVAGGDAENFSLVGNGTVGSLAFEGGAASAEMVGTYVVLTGFGAVDGSRFPVIAFTAGGGGDPDTLTLAGVPAVDLTGAAGATYSTYVGVGPVPNGAPFLLGAADEINVSKEAGDVVPAIDEDFNAHGQGFELIDNPEMAQYLPHTVPFDGTEVTFECDTCGADGTGEINAGIVINGETTDAPLDGLNPAAPMPEPETQYATFQCSFLGQDVATLSADAMAAILGTNPTRIQVSVGRYRGKILTEDESSTIMLQGHAFLGWSDAE